MPSMTSLIASRRIDELIGRWKALRKMCFTNEQIGRGGQRMSCHIAIWTRALIEASRASNLATRV